MSWFWIDHRPRLLSRSRLLLVLVPVFLFYWLCCYRFAATQANSLDGQVFSLQGRVLSQTCLTYGWRAVVRQPDGFRLMLYCPEEPGVGSKVSGAVQARRPRTRRNPGGFDEAAWLAEQGIFLVVEPLAGQTLRCEAAPLLAPARLVSSLRSSLRTALDRLLPPPEAGLLAALLLGDGSGLDQTTRIDFSLAGLAHLTAVSGLHLSCLQQPLNRLLRRRGLAAERRYALLICSLLVFALITGWRVSLVRAVAMTVASLLGRLLLRRTQPLYSLGVAVFLLLLHNPFAVLGSSFWMTTSATAAVICCSGPISERLARFGRWLPRSLAQAFAVVLSAQLGSIWWSVRLSKSFFLPGVFFNVAGGFLAALILWLGLALLLPAWLLLLAGVNISCLSWPAWVLCQLLRLLKGLAAWLARLPWGRLYACHLNFFWTAALVVLFCWLLIGLGVLPAPPQRIWRQRHRCFAGLLLAGFLLAGGFWLLGTPVRVWFLDVGQGDALILQDRYGHAILVDSGRDGQGLAVVRPALDALGIRCLDLAMITHGHQDHIGGLDELIDYGRVRQVLLAEGLAAAVERSRQEPGALDGDSAGLPDLLLVAEKAGVPVQSVRPRDTIALGRHIRMNVLAPPDDAIVRREAQRDGNAWSLILLADCAGTRFLLTGDCSKAAEQRLIRTEAWPRAHVLKVAHHGSGQTTSAEMLRQTQPVLAIIPVGANAYGHPANAVLERLDQAGCAVCRTDRQGAVRVDCRDGIIKIKAYQPLDDWDGTSPGSR
ncbi:MAG: DNA internalization-related competence protein ComEC/Rec2 [Ruminococcaceae bacterium]|nr:DNA internalization-related competence protein ComEC/Rec2 [Oscillospiraceae bacterium]